jgi:hypothetical protein
MISELKFRAFAITAPKPNTPAENEHHKAMLDILIKSSY